MTRSRKKPFAAMTGAASDKVDKQRHSRKYRHREKQALRTGATEIPPRPKDGDWDFSKEGKYYTGLEKDTRK